MNFRDLISNLRINPDLANNVMPIQSAAGTDGVVGMPVIKGMNFDGNAGLKRTNTEMVKIKSETLSHIISEVGLKRIDYMKSDCKGCENAFTKADFDLINNGVEIECSSNIDVIAKRLISAGFNISIRHYDPTNLKPLDVGGTILAFRKKPS